MKELKSASENDARRDGGHPFAVKTYTRGEVSRLAGVSEPTVDYYARAGVLVRVPHPSTPLRSIGFTEKSVRGFIVDRGRTMDGAVDASLKSVSIRGAARILGVCHQTVGRLIGDGRLDAVDDGASRRVTMRSVLALVNEGEKPKSGCVKTADGGSCIVKTEGGAE